MSLEEHINIFNANSLDPGFVPSSSGSVINPLLGLATPRQSIDNIEPFTSNDSAASIQQSTRDLRNRERNSHSRLLLLQALACHAQI